MLVNFITFASVIAFAATLKLNNAVNAGAVQF
jgi:hypothetical protein